MFLFALKGRLEKVEVCGSNITCEVCILSSGVFALGRLSGLNVTCTESCSVCSLFLGLFYSPFSRPEFASLLFVGL